MIRLLHFELKVSTSRLALFVTSAFYLFQICRFIVYLLYGVQSCRLETTCKRGSCMWSSQLIKVKAMFTSAHIFSFYRLVQQWHPTKMMNEKAAECFDWGLLTVMIAVLLARPNWEQMMTQDSQGDNVPSIERIREFCHRETHAELRSLLEKLLSRAKWPA